MRGDGAVGSCSGGGFRGGGLSGWRGASCGQAFGLVPLRTGYLAEGEEPPAQRRMRAGQ